MVTWGQNQVFTVPGKGAPAPAPATGFSFGGATPTPAPGSFGSTTPAPASGGLFSSTAPAPAPSGGLFGSSQAPAPSTGLFGSTSPAPAPSTSLFASTPAPSPGFFGGTPAPSPAGGLFGNTPAPASGGGLFGATATQQAAPPSGPQIPAYAAMQAHMDASARQEAAKLQTALEKYHKAYTGAPTNDKTKFVTILYNDISPQQRQLQWVMGAPGQQVVPPKPPVVSEKEWLEAVVRNPDPELYMPFALVGAVELQSRVAWQQDRANGYAKHLQGLQKSRATLQQNCIRMETHLQTLVRLESNLRSRLLQVMQKVEIVRNRNQPLQHDEDVLKQKLQELLHQVNQLNTLLATVSAKAQAQLQTRQATLSVVNVPEEKELSTVLKGHRETLIKMSQVMEKDKRDVALLKQHVVSKVSMPPALR